MENKIRSQLKSACHLFGGQKAVAVAAKVDSSNFGKWLNGKPTLSEVNVDAVLSVLGLPNESPDTSKVHIWPMMKSDHKYSLSMRLYFPNGTKIARSPWAKAGWGNFRRALRIAEPPPSVYLLNDGQVRAVLRLAPGVLIQKTNMENFVQWHQGSIDSSVVNICETDLKWTHGTPTIQEFDEVWNVQEPQVTVVDLVNAVHNEGISLDEAIRRIKRTQ